jgi:hypothetical protein
MFLELMHNFYKKKTYIKPNLVTLSVLPLYTCTLVPVVLPLLEAPIGVLFGMAVRFAVVSC